MMHKVMPVMPSENVFTNFEVNLAILSCYFAIVYHEKVLTNTMFENTKALIYLLASSKLPAT